MKKRFFLNAGALALLLCGMAFLPSCEKDPQPSYFLTVTEPLGFMADSVTFEDGMGYSLNCPAFLADSLAGLIRGIIQQRGHYTSHVTGRYTIRDVAGYPLISVDLLIGSTTDRPAYLILHSPTGRKEYEF